MSRNMDGLMHKIVNIGIIVRILIWQRVLWRQVLALPNSLGIDGTVVLSSQADRCTEQV
jgi:hypothetical protein